LPEDELPLPLLLPVERLGAFHAKSDHLRLLVVVAGRAVVAEGLAVVPELPEVLDFTPLLYTYPSLDVSIKSPTLLSAAYFFK
jgi:hypothetical protein